MAVAAQGRADVVAAVASQIVVTVACDELVVARIPNALTAERRTLTEQDALRPLTTPFPE